MVQETEQNNYKATSEQRGRFVNIATRLIRSKGFFNQGRESTQKTEIGKTTAIASFHHNAGGDKVLEVVLLDQTAGPHWKWKGVLSLEDTGEIWPHFQEIKGVTPKSFTITPNSRNLAIDSTLSLMEDTIGATRKP